MALSWWVELAVLTMARHFYILLLCALLKRMLRRSKLKDRLAQVASGQTAGVISYASS